MDKKRVMFCLCTLIAIFVIPSVIFAASFDCSKASTKTEKAICGDPTLSKLDEDMAAAYSKALKTSEPDAVKKEQRKWLKEILAPCIEDKVCIKKAYDNRLRQLESSALVEPTSPQDSNINPEAVSACFNRLANKSLPFEIYSDPFNDCKIYIQPFQKDFGLSTNAIPFIECADEVDVAPLCNGNFIVVWKFSHHRFPVPLTGRIFDSNFKTVQGDFKISDNEGGLEEWEHSISTLYNGGFVVTWKTWKTFARKEIKLKGRIFDATGKPRGKSFDIYSKGNNSGGFVYGMPTGGFFVVWSNSETKLAGSALLKIYNAAGKPITKEIIIESYSKSTDCLLKPRGYVTQDGKINIFINCQSQDFIPNNFFHSARSFNKIGNPMTDVLAGAEMKSLEGYIFVREQHIKEKAFFFEILLRKFKESRHCDGQLSQGYYMKVFTNDQRMKRFFTYCCAEFEKHCFIPRFLKDDINKCLQE